MTNREKILYWVNLADYDMITAQTMLDGGRYLYVGFMCHQVVEKIFKAYYSKMKAETPP
jgi:HEPN domain-containing protein